MKVVYVPDHLQGSAALETLLHGRQKVDLKGQQELTATLDNLHVLWQKKRAEVLQGGRFAAERSQYCESCAYTDICRKDDPRYRGKIAPSRLWKKSQP